MTLDKLSLFSTKREFGYFILISLFILSYSLLIEFNNYKNLTKFDSNIVKATVLKQYTKTKQTKKGKTKTYQVLKLKAEQGFVFYTTTDIEFPDSKAKELELEIWAGKKSFKEYMTSFYAFSKIINTNSTTKQKVNDYIATKHQDENITNIYQALYTASPLDYKLQSLFSTLGVSHLLAISGFHLGVLSFLLFFIFKTPYKFLQNRYFPYRSYKLDSFVIIISTLFLYLYFLDTPPSLLRAFVMLLIAFILYDRGYEIISMGTLFLTAIIIICFAPRLFLSLGFWLSVFGVFYIFLFLIHFKSLNRYWQFILVPIWVYLAMLIHSIYIFENFSIYHPVSIIWSIVFVVFYPLSIFLHTINQGELLDTYLIMFLNIPVFAVKVYIAWYIELLFILLSLLSIWKKRFMMGLIIFSISILVYAFYQLNNQA